MTHHQGRLKQYHKVHPDSLPLRPIKSEHLDDVEDDINPDSDALLQPRHRHDNEEDDEYLLDLKPPNIFQGLLAFMSRLPLLSKNRSGQGYASVPRRELPSRDGILDADQNSTDDSLSRVKRKGKCNAAVDAQIHDPRRSGTTTVHRSRKTLSQSGLESRAKGIGIFLLIREL